MSSGMNRTQAEEYAKTMTYKQAISNIRTGKGVVHRKATMIKLHELAEIVDRLVMCKECKNTVCDFLGADGFCSYGERREESEVEE